MVIAIKSHIDFQNIKILFFFFLTFFPRILVRARTRVFELVDFVLEMFFFFVFCKWKLFTSNRNGISIYLDLIS